MYNLLCYTMSSANTEQRINSETTAGRYETECNEGAVEMKNIVYIIHNSYLFSKVMGLEIFYFLIWATTSKILNNRYNLD